MEGKYIMNKNELDKKRVLELLERDSQFLDVNIMGNR